MSRLRIVVLAVIVANTLSCSFTAHTLHTSATTFFNTSPLTEGLSATLNLQAGYFRVGEVKFPAKVCSNESTLPGPCFESDYFNFDPSHLPVGTNYNSASRRVNCFAMEEESRFPVILWPEVQESEKIVFIYSPTRGLVGWKLTAGGDSDTFVLSGVTLSLECSSALKDL